MSLDGSVLRLYDKYSWGGSNRLIARPQRTERRTFLWQLVRLAESKIEGSSIPYVWIGTAQSSLLLVVTTFLLTYKFTTVLLLLIHLLQTTIYTIITEDQGDGSFQSVSLRDLRARGVDTFIASQDLSESPWVDGPYYVWAYTGVLPHHVFQITARPNHPIRSMMNPAGRLEYTRRLLRDILNVATCYRLF